MGDKPTFTAEVDSLLAVMKMKCVGVRPQVVGYWRCGGR